MRRRDREVTEPQEILEIMKQCQVLHLAIRDVPAPYLLPVNFGMEPDGMTLYIHGAAQGKKYALLQQDNRVGFEMEDTRGLVLDEKNHDCSMNYASVMGWGIVEEILEEGEKRHALDRIMAQYHSEAFPYSLQAIPRTRILRLRVMERTGKSRKPPKGSP